MASSYSRYNVPDERADSPKIELTVHFEPEPTEHPDAHIRLNRIDNERGMQTLTSFSEEHEVDYDYYTLEDSE